MTLPRISVHILLGWSCLALCGLGLARPASVSESSSPQDSGAEARLSRGKRLMLKDGGFQLVRSYERKGDRVRYYSVERGDWEEIPSAMVDWDATKKAEADAARADEALVSKVHTQEEATKMETVLDVDASLQVAPGVFLPPGEGMFAVARAPRGKRNPTHSRQPSRQSTESADTRRRRCAPACGARNRVREE